jgi:hypothetical protein
MLISHSDYNKFVQSVQSDATSWGFETRIRYSQKEPPAPRRRAYFEVFYNGTWHMIGAETPFAKDDAERDAWTDEDLWAQLQARAAHALVTS